MEYSVLGPTGVNVSKICLGTATFGVAPDAQEAGRVVHAALDLGINFFDTANVYGATPTFDRPGAPPATEREPAEQLLGRALVGRRDDVVIATKSGERRFDPAAGLSRRYIIHQVEHSLRRLGTDYIDVYYAHFPDPTPRWSRPSWPTTIWCGKESCATWPFPLVNSLPVAPVHEPECQLVNHVALVHQLSPASEGNEARDGRSQWRWNRVWPQGLKTARVTVVTSTGSAPNGARVTAMPVGPIPVVGNSAMGTNSA